ncbi:MAG: Xaa-Pro peptidase family protein [Candidatus Brocadiaceae bacterium]|nr:Xaa-Pro peptidase family protein [Candidatus Brocadiaceae bacterium]
MDCVERLKEKLKKDKVGGLLITNEINIRYVTGFTGSESIVLITPRNDYLFTDFRYVEQARQDVSWVKVIEKKVSLISAICKKLKQLNIKKLYIESLHLSLSRYNEIRKHTRGIQLLPTQGIVESYRKRKTQDEIRKIQISIDIAEKAFSLLRKKIRPGMTEKNVAGILEYEMRNLGAEKSSFDIICAVDKHASQPHALNRDTKIQKKSAVLLDWGARFQFYNSDLTRICPMDRISSRFKRIYQIVLDAQRFAIESIKPGIKAKDVDAMARGYIEKSGFGRNFGHGLGHGIGLEVHEGPAINKTSKEILEEGMVFTVEPGIYIPEWGGIRIEDMVLVTPHGCDVLSRIPKELSEIAI